MFSGKSTIFEKYSYESLDSSYLQRDHFKIMSYEMANINLHLVFQIENYFPQAFDTAKELLTGPEEGNTLDLFLKIS
jgi:hypothetical protein